MTNNIQNIRFKQFSEPLVEPFEIALGTQEILKNVVVEVETEDGVTGIGEIAPVPTVTGETQQTALAAGEFAGDLIKGMPIENYRGISEKLRSQLGAQSAARAGIEIAIFDALGKHFRAPLSDIVGGYREVVETDDTIGIVDLESAKEAASEAIDSGFKDLKIKIGVDLESDLERVSAVRNVAPNAEIKVDANQGYVPKEAIEFAERADDRGLDIDLFEQPVHYDNIAGLRRVTESTSLKVAADESVFTKEDAARVVASEAADVINIKLMKSGIVDALEIIGLAQAHGLELMIGCMLESRIGITAGAHMVSGSGAFEYVDLDGHFSIDSEIGETDYSPDHYITGPGLGLDVDFQQI